MTFSHFRVLARLAVCICAALLVLSACNISQDEKVSSNISFNKIYDDLAVYDSVIIALKDDQGRTLDIVFKGKVENPSDVENLPAPHWDGGKVIVSITGFNAAGEEIYKIEANFDGKTNQKDSVKTFRFPGSSLTVPNRSLLMAEGDSLPLPTVTIDPANLADKTLLWSSSNTTVADIKGSFIKAMGPGSSEITAKLQADPSVVVKVQVKVEVGGRIPESLALTLDTLYVPAGGASRIIPVKVLPLTASTEVTWRSDNSLVAAVAEDGAISGLVIGHTKVWATSKIKSSLFDSAWVMVTEPISVASVRFISDSVDIFIGGAAELLAVEILPLEANQTVDFTVLDPAKVELKDNRIRGLTEGQTTVTVYSKEDPSKTDILKIKIHPNQQVDSVRVSPKTLKLFVGGDKLNLTGKVHPASAPQAIQWVSGNKAYATVDSSGMVTAVAAGNLKVYAYSQADSLAKDSAAITVKVDPPVVRIGEDTVISVGQTISFLPIVEPQEFGLVTGFKWDLNGDSAWDSSSSGIRPVSYKYDQEKAYKVRFWVKDTEGNETEVSKSVHAVKGAIVLIQSPLNNSYSRVALIPVKWTVDGAEQDSLLSQTLKDGPNIITRTIKDAAGTPFSHSVIVTLDSVAPNKPRVHGPAASNSATPTWTWSSGGGGGNGTYRFKLDGVDFSASPETKDTLYTPALALTEGVHTLNVQERDAGGNWSEVASLPIKYDLSKPTVIIKSPQESGTFLTRSATLDISGTVAKSAGGSPIQKIVYTVDGVAGTLSTNLVVDGTWTIKALPLVNNKAIALKVIASDALSNSGEAVLSIHMDASAPVAPVISASPPAIVSKLDARTSLVWTWNAPETASDSFLVKLNGTDVSRQTGSSYTISNPADGEYQLEVFEKDLAGNVSAGKKSVTTLFDHTAPGMPDMTKPASPRKTAQWTWTTGGGGSGSFQCSLNDGIAFTCASPYSLPNPTDGDHTLRVRELDAALNPSTWASASGTIDLRKPVISLGSYKTIPAQVFNVIQPFVGTAADERALRYVQYKVGSDSLITASGSGTWSFTPILSEGTQAITIYAEDVAGNKDSAKVSVTYLPKVVFVRKGASSGNGSSWENAYPELGTVLASDKLYDAGTQIWVTEGTYIPANAKGFVLKSNSSVLGGFSSAGTNRSLADRNLAQQASILQQHPDGSTVISNGYKIETSGEYIYGENVSLSDFNFIDGRNPIFIGYASKIVLKNIKIINLDCSTCISILSSNVDILDSRLNLNSSGDGTINANNSKVRMRNTELNLNNASDGGGITLIGGAFCAEGLSSIYSNTPSEVQNNGGEFSYEESVTIGPNGISNGTGEVVGKCPAPF